MSEQPAHRLKRLAMRSMRRGIKEMDLILPRYAEMRLATMSQAELATYDLLLDENDHDLYQWVSRQSEPSEPFAPLINEIRQMLDSKD